MYADLHEANAKQNVPAQSFTYFDNFRGLHFLNDLFKKHPSLFETPTPIDKHANAVGSFVFYLLYSGQMVKAQSLFDEFELFVSNSNPKILTSKNIYSTEGLNLITWARYLKETSIFIIFEPILKLNNVVLQSFLETQKFIWSDRNFKLQDLKAIGFTNIGENITELLPYIAYIYNFLINCSPYEFNSVANGNVQTIYTQQLNQYFESNWKKLIKNYPMLRIEQLYQSLDTDELLKIVNPDDIRNLLQDILSPESLLEIRNEIIQNNAEMLDSCVRDQLMLSQENIFQGFHEVFTRLVDIVLNNSPITKLHKQIPFFSSFNPDMEITWRIVNWCLCGSNTPFFIDNDFNFFPLRKYLLKLQGVKEMKIETDIQKGILNGKVPFLLSDPAQQIVIGYIIQEFTDLLNDLSINTDTILPGELDANQSIEGEVFSIVMNGTSANHNQFISEIFKNLNPTDKLILDKLQNSLNKFFPNSFANNIIRSFIFLNFSDNLLQFISKNNSISGFSNFIEFCLLPDEERETKILKLLNIEYALMCVHNKTFVNLVNSMSSRIISIILHNSFIFNTYIKGTTDKIHQWVIGGISLCRKSIISNPLVRGIEFIRRVLGTTEEFECMRNWLIFLDNQTINETIEDFIQKNDVTSIKNILVSRFNNYKKLSCLENWKIVDGKVQLKNNPYFLDNLTEVIRFTFSKQSPKNVQTREIFWRPIKITPSSKSTSVPFKNKFFINRTECGSYLMENGEYVNVPIIEFNSVIETVSMIYQPPNGLKVLKIISPSGEILENNSFFIFTNGSTTETWIKKPIEYEGLTKMTIEGGDVKVNPGTF